jgi:hypothetical protein
MKTKKIYRFMSKEEAMRFLSYRGLINADVQADKGNKSNAQGFCFGIGDEAQATKDWRRLKGIVAAEYLLVGVLKPDEHFVRCKGKYIDWELYDKLISTEHCSQEQIPTTMFDELCSMFYSRPCFKSFAMYKVEVENPGMQIGLQQVNDSDEKFRPGNGIAAVVNYWDACERLANVINEQLFDDSRDPYWIGGVCRGLCDFGDTDFLTPEEMALIIQDKVTYEQYAEWREANLASECKINLQSWLKCARHSMQKDKKANNE